MSSWNVFIISCSVVFSVSIIAAFIAASHLPQMQAQVNPIWLCNTQ